MSTIVVLGQDTVFMTSNINVKALRTAVPIWVIIMAELPQAIILANIPQSLIFFTGEPTESTLGRELIASAEGEGGCRSDEQSS